MTSLPKTVPHLGLYLYTNAVDDIADANGLDETAKFTLIFEMANAIRSGKLITRVAATGGPDVNPSSEVKVQDVNAWLSANGYPYQWVQPQLVQQSIPSSAIKIKVKYPEPITKRNIARAFSDVYFSYDKWVKYLASPPKWLEPCRMAKGTKSIPSTWNPVEIALELSNKHISLRSLNLAIKKLPEWAEEWEEKSEFLST